MCLYTYIYIYAIYIYEKMRFHIYRVPQINACLAARKCSSKYQGFHIFFRSRHLASL